MKDGSDSRLPTFAVIIPTYNRAARLVSTLQSVFDQERPPAEIIVVDDCSTDDTPDVMAGLMKVHGNLQYHRHDVNMERAAARNTGMAEASADYITFLDSDDIMYPQCLRAAGDFAVETGSLLFHSLYESVDEEGNHLRYWPTPPLDNTIREIALGNFLSCIGNFIHRDIYRDYRFDPNPVLAASEDWDFWLRVCADHSVARLSEVNNGVVEHAGRSMRNQDVAVVTRRVEYVLSKVDSDPHLSSVYGPYRSLMRAGRMVILAIVANDNHDSKAAFGFLRRALMERPAMIVSPRFIRCLQIAVMNWLRRVMGAAPAGHGR